jgi:hypothetical protein
LFGCGYAFGPRSAAIGISPFSNETFKPGIEILARDLILQRLAEGNASVVEEKRAELILKGAVVRYSIDPVAFDFRDISRQYRVTISINFSVAEKAGGKASWEETLSASSYYYTGPDVAATEIAENRASNQALQELAKMVAVRLREVS